MRDLNDDTLLWDCNTLATWIKPTEQQLNLVMRPAYHKGMACIVIMLVARDLVLKCLQGDPRSRPTGMREILSHQLFYGPQDIVLTRPLPHPDRGELDVIFSYRTIDTAEMMRLRQFFNALGISTADGSQVPPEES